MVRANLIPGGHANFFTSKHLLTRADGSAVDLRHLLSGIQFFTVALRIEVVPDNGLLTDRIEDA